MANDQTAARRELERTWATKLTEARVRYHHAAASYHMLSEEYHQSLISGPDGTEAIRKAHREEAAALREYTRVVRIFTDVVRKGRTPAEE